MKKILICLLISMCCFTPFSFTVFADDNSSSWFFPGSNNSLSSVQQAWVCENYETWWLNNTVGTLGFVFVYEDSGELAMGYNVSGNSYLYYRLSLTGNWINYNERKTSFPLDPNDVGAVFYDSGNYLGQGFVNRLSDLYSACLPTATPTPTPTPTPSPPTSSDPDGNIELNFFVNNPEFGFVASDRIVLNEYDEWSNFVVPYEGYKFLYWINTSNGFKYTNRELTGTAFNDNSYVAFLTKENEALNIYLPDFNNLLSNPAVASLVQEATNLDTNFWYIDRTIYSYHAPPGCSVNGVVSVGYTEVFELYVMTGSSFTLQSDSIGSNTSSIYNCGGSEQVGSIDSSPFVREQVLTSFDLWSIPDTDFYEMLIDIYDLIATNPEISYLIQNGQYLHDLLATYKEQSVALINGTESSNNVSNSLQDSNTSLNDAVSQYDQAEKAFTDDFKVNVDAIDTNFSWGSQFLNSANFVRTSFNELVEPAPIYYMILFSLILGFALFIIGRLR